MENYLNQLCNKYPDFLKSLDTFPNNIRETIVKKHTESKDETTFTSTLAEVDFAQHFISLGFDVEYEKKYLKKEPDWTLSIGNSKAICEVYRLGKSVNDQTINMSIRGIYRPIKHKPEKIIQYSFLKKDNNITHKLSKYNEVIAKTNYPYFIAIALDFASGFYVKEFAEYFRGKSVGFDCEDNSDYEALEEDKDYGTEWTELGVFYENPQLSGLIILDNKKFYLLLNPLKSQVIYKPENHLILDNLKRINNL